MKLIFFIFFTLSIDSLPNKYTINFCTPQIDESNLQLKQIHTEIFLLFVLQLLPVTHSRRQQHSFDLSSSPRVSQ